MTSHDVVARIRKILGIKKVGHAGTLDPLATGVLVLCLGRATRLSNYLTGQRKRYRTRVRLGVETDTLDADGTVVAESSDIPGSIDEIEIAVRPFRGRIRQVPPMYSARKVGGERLHKLARAGKTVEREAREVDVYKLVVLDYQPPVLDLDVVCSKGTYIRSLVADIGHKLGCGGSVQTLRRTQSGSITESDCVSLDEVTAETVSEALIDPNEALADIAEYTLDEVEIRRFAHGNSILTNQKVESPCRVVDQEGAFWGIGQAEGSDLLQPVCVLREMGSLRDTDPA